MSGMVGSNAGLRVSGSADGKTPWVRKRSREQIEAVVDLLLELASERDLVEDPMTERICLAALSLDVDNPSAKKKLGRIRAAQGRVNEAKVLFQHAEEHLDLSVLLAAEGNYAVARETAVKALDTNPAGAHSQLMAIASETGDLAAMELHAETGLKFEPNHPILRQGRGVIRVGRGDRSGFKDLSYRQWHQEIVAHMPKPEWKGDPLEHGTRLLIVGEEGIGDQIMYSRFIKPILGGKYGPGFPRVLLEPGQGLARLFRQSFPECAIATTVEELRAHGYDAWIATGTLPELGMDFGMRAPYLNWPFPGDPQRIVRNTGNLKVALCWAGKPEHLHDHFRSMPFGAFEPLWDIAGVDFYAFQFGEAAAENSWMPDLTRLCEDYADSASMLENIDLVISVDTSLVHLAGALGKPCWVLPRSPIDWRWGIPAERNDWYPSVRQFRNADIQKDVAPALEQLVTERVNGVLNGELAKRWIAVPPLAEGRRRS